MRKEGREGGRKEGRNEEKRQGVVSYSLDVKQFGFPGQQTPSCATVSVSSADGVNPVAQVRQGLL